MKNPSLICALTLWDHAANPQPELAISWYSDYMSADRPEDGMIINLDGLWPGRGALVIYPPKK